MPYYISSPLQFVEILQEMKKKIFLPKVVLLISRNADVRRPRKFSADFFPSKLEPSLLLKLSPKKSPDFIRPVSYNNRTIF